MNSQITVGTFKRGRDENRKVISENMVTIQVGDNMGLPRMVTVEVIRMLISWILL